MARQLLPLRLLALTLLVLALALSTGCGGGSSSSGGTSNGLATKTPDEVLAAVEAALANAQSVHITGSGLDDQQSMEVDLRLVAGEGGYGEITAQGVTFEIVVTDDRVYIHGDDSFWKAIGQEAAGRLLSGKWLMAPATGGNFGDLAEFADLETFFDQILSEHGALENQGATTVDGDSVVKIVDTTEGGTLYVAAEGTAYPLRLDAKDSAGVIRFDDWDEDVEIDIPDDVVDASRLTQLGNG